VALSNPIEKTRQTTNILKKTNAMKSKENVLETFHPYFVKRITKVSTSRVNSFNIDYVDLTNKCLRMDGAQLIEVVFKVLQFNS
jgi:hypothetical protein